METFEKLGLAPQLLRAIRAEGYHTATPIQLQAIPGVLAGRDLMGCAQTGTGKTAAFALPTLHRLSAADERSRDGNGNKRRAIRCLILAPTRELAAQIGESFAAYGRYTGLKHTVVFGGVNQGSQVRALQSGVEILIATPGRLLDLMQQGYIHLNKVEILILDEADQMLDMGFLPDLKRIVAAVPRERQTLMFSATMPDEIRQLADRWLREPLHVRIGAVATPVELIKQSVYHVDARNKPHLLEHFLRNSAGGRTLVFARTKHGADKIVKRLMHGGIRAAAIHGNKSQNARTRVLAAFKSQCPPVLVATDVAARGLDIDDVSHVINYELPQVPEMYVHRIGRTARAGAEGVAVSFCGREERGLLQAIERLTRRTIDVATEQPNYPAGESRAHNGAEVQVAQGQSRRRRSRPKSATGGRGGNGQSSHGGTSQSQSSLGQSSQSQSSRGRSSQGQSTGRASTGRTSWSGGATAGGKRGRRRKFARGMTGG